MKQKNFAICFIQIILCSFVYASSELEILWDKCEKNSGNLKIAKMQEDLAAINSDYSGYVYLPTFMLYAANGYTRTYKNIEKFPYSAETSFATSFTVPGGGVVKSEAGYKLNRYFMDDFGNTESDNIGYDQIPSFSLAYTQSLNPAFFHFNGDPISESYKNELEFQISARKSSELSVKVQVAYDYILLRKNLRQLNNSNKAIELLEYTISYLEENRNRGVISMIDIWECQNKYLDCSEKLIEHTEQKEKILSELKILCGDDLNILYDSELPTDQVIFVPYDFTLRQLDLQNKNLFIQNILDNQNYAPKLGLQCSSEYELETVHYKKLADAWKEKGIINWTVGISLEFSPENISRLRRNKKLFKKNLEISQEQRNLYLTNKDVTLSMYDKIISHYESLFNTALETFLNKKKYYETLEIQVSRGINTQLELKQAELVMDEADTVLKNYSDMIWYYKWLKSLVI